MAADLGGMQDRARPVVHGPPAARRRGPVPAHSRDDIAAAAVGLADTSGLAALSMRAVAAALGTGAASLYRYVASRHELVDLMTDHVLRELQPFPPADGPWLDIMIRVGRRQLELYRRHPWLLEVMQSAPGLGPGALAWLDHCLHVLEPVDCASAVKFEAIAMMTGVTTLFARSGATPPSALPPIDRRAYPHLTAAAAHPAASSPAPRPDLYDRALRSLLTGLLAPSPNAERGQDLPGHG